MHANGPHQKKQNMILKTRNEVALRRLSYIKQISPWVASWVISFAYILLTCSTSFSFSLLKKKKDFFENPSFCTKVQHKNTCKLARGETFAFDVILVFRWSGSELLKDWAGRHSVWIHQAANSQLNSEAREWHHDSDKTQTNKPKWRTIFIKPFIKEPMILTHLH